MLELDREFSIKLKGEDVKIRSWIYRRGSAKVVFFEALSPSWASKLCERLYIESNDEEKVYKYILLAKASAKYIEEFIGIEKIDYVDLQEAYTFLALLALPELSDKARAIVHTPGPWGHPVFPTDILRREFGVEFRDRDVVLTRIGLDRASRVFVVSVKQRDIIGYVFPEYRDKFVAITNGVDLERWTHNSIKKLLTTSDTLTPENLWKAHLEAKRELLSFIKKYKDIDVDIDTPVVLWARRLTFYKRPYFIYRFIEEHGKDLSVLFILGGKPHPADSYGLETAKKFMKLHREFKNVVYIHDYDIHKAKILLSGCDIHLFTPFSGWEACGTSYMKTGINGIPTISSRDGGAIEMIVDGVNGWLFGKDLREFINIYEDSRAKTIDEEDYREFSNKLLKAIDMYMNNADRFREMCLKTLTSFRLKADIVRMLCEYYPEKIE